MIQIKCQKNYSCIISLFSIILFLGLCFFIIDRFLFIIHFDNFSFVEKSFSIILLFTITFWGVHSVGYIDHFLKSIFAYRIRQVNSFNNKKQPSVAILLPVFNENPKLVKTIIKSINKINYDNVKIYLLDDSNVTSIKQNLKTLAKRYNFNYITRKERKGFKAGAINHCINLLKQDIQYLCILDVDHCPKNNILSDLIPMIEEDKSIAYIQTPQYFKKENNNNLALAYSFQQHIFYKHVCRGLSVNNSVFMCGTNVIIRLKYLKEIGGLDEKSITEDLATSFNFHFHGYKSVYLDKIYSIGMPPPSLSAYFIQQMRWSYGTLKNLKQVFSSFIKQPKKLKPIQWWEFIVLNGTWYLLGWTLLLWLIYPIIIILFKLQPVPLGSINYPFIIFLLMISGQFITSAHERNYRIKDLLLAQGLFFSLFSIYIGASIYVLLGKKMEFKVTPKEGTKSISLTELYPHLIILLLLILSISIGLYDILSRDIYNINQYWMITWAFYNTTILLLIFYFYIDDIKGGKIHGQE